MHTIRLKIRDLEVEGIGFDSFEKFEPILNKAVEIWKGSGGNEIVKTPANAPPVPKVVNASSGETLDMSINSFVAKVGGDSCRNLLKASAGYLVLVKGEQKLKREDLINTAKDSTSWKKNFVNQTGINIERMIKHSELIENSSGIYSLPSPIVEEMQSKL